MDRMVVIAGLLAWLETPDRRWLLRRLSRTQRYGLESALLEVSAPGGRDRWLARLRYPASGSKTGPDARRIELEELVMCSSRLLRGAPSAVREALLELLESGSPRHVRSDHGVSAASTELARATVLRHLRNGRQSMPESYGG